MVHDRNMDEVNDYSVRYYKGTWIDNNGYVQPNQSKPLIEINETLIDSEIEAINTVLI